MFLCSSNNIIKYDIHFIKNNIFLKFVVSICYNGYIILFQNQNT